MIYLLSQQTISLWKAHLYISQNLCIDMQVWYNVLLPIVILLRASRLFVWPFQQLLFSRRALILSKDKWRKETSEFRIFPLYNFIFSITKENIDPQIQSRGSFMLLPWIQLFTYSFFLQIYLPILSKHGVMANDRIIKLFSRCKTLLIERLLLHRTLSFFFHMLLPLN